MIKSIVEAVTIPVMAKVRIGHFVEAQVRHHHSVSHSFPLELESIWHAYKTLMSGFTDPPSHRHRLYR